MNNDQPRPPPCEKTTLKSLDPDVHRTVAVTANVICIPEEQMHNIQPYNLDLVLISACAFQQVLLFFVNDAGTNNFIVLHNLPVNDWR